jgi:uracil-DNA glycosylase
LRDIIKATHPSWHKSLQSAFRVMDSEYLEFLKSGKYFPNRDNFLNAFKTLPKSDVKYILFGQDPYPREESAIGYAFIDGKVKSIFSQNGLSKEVNRATSLRNFIKMALVAMGRLEADNTSKEAVAKVKKDDLISSIFELKDNFERNGVMLLNTALIFTDKKESKYHIKQWQPFIKELLSQIDSSVELILFGNFAKDIKKLNLKQKTIEMEHPYNVSFINSKEAHNLFANMNLLFHNF